MITEPDGYIQQKERYIMQEFMIKVNEAKVEYYKQKEYLENRIEFRQQQIARLEKRRDSCI